MSALLMLGLTSVSYADIKFFWLDRPTSRSNSHDPASPNYVTNTPTGPTNTFTDTPTWTPTKTPTWTNTPPAGATNTYTPTPTITNTPCASCHTALVADFEEADNSVDLWSGAISTSSSGNAGAFVGAFASTISPNPWVAGSATAGSGNPGSCGCVSGTVGEQASPWPWVSYQFNLGAVAGTDVNVSAYATNHGIKFDFKAAAAGVAYRVRVKQQDVTDSGFYGYTFTPSDTAWHTLTVYFPGYGGGQPEFAQPSWAAAQPFGTVMNGIEFIAVGSASAATTYGFCVDNVTFAVAVQPTDTPTPGGATATWPTIYNGENVPLGTNFYTAGGSGGAVDTAGAGAGGSAHYADVTLSCAAAGYAAVGAFSTGFDASANPLTQSVAAASGYTALSISVKVAAAGSCAVPSISIVTKNGVQKTSVPVSMETYLVGGPKFMSSGTWYTAVIPISAFSYGTDGTGFNGKASPNSDTITAADLTMLTAVQVEPSYAADGSVNTELYVDDIVFNNATPTLNSAGITPLFCDFEHGTAANWGDYWASFEDQDKPDFTCTWAADGPSTRVYPTCGNCPNPVPVVTPPVMAGAGGPATPCNFGRFAGHVSNSNPAATGCTVNALGGNYSYMGMGVFFLLSHGPADILSLIGSYFLGNGNRPHGIQLDMKSGPNADPSQTYTMFVTLDNVSCGGCDAGTDLAPTSSWTTVQIPFPANGTALTSNSPNGGFGQPSWAPLAGTVTWDSSGTSTDTLRHFQQLKFQADNRGVNVDLEVDNIQFY